MRDCLVSFASGRFNRPLLDLLDSALEHWKGDFLIYSPDHELEFYKGIKINKGWPEPQGFESYTHEQMPFQFKIALITQAKEMGYERIVWLDTSMRLNKDITPLFGDTGVGVFHNLGHDLWKYISDDAVRILMGSPEWKNVTPVGIKEVPQIWGGMLFFDFTNINARVVFRAIKKASVNGSFAEGGSIREGFIAHRHDQAVISVLVYKHCNMYPYGMVASVTHAESKEYGDDIYLIYGK